MWVLFPKLTTKFVVEDSRGDVALVDVLSGTISTISTAELADVEIIAEFARNRLVLKSAATPWWTRAYGVFTCGLHRKGGAGRATLTERLFTANK